MTVAAQTQQPGFIRPLAIFNFHLARLASWLAGGMLAVMVLMILAQVFYRYVLNDSLAWTEELAKFCMVWVACLVAPWVYRENLNVSIHMFAESLPDRLRMVTEIVITCLVLAVSLAFLNESIAFVGNGSSIQASSVPVPLSYFYACTPFVFGALILVAIEKLCVQFYQLVTDTITYPSESD